MPYTYQNYTIYNVSCRILHCHVYPITYLPFSLFSLQSSLATTLKFRYQ